MSCGARTTPSAALEFREAHFFNASGMEPSTFPECYSESITQEWAQAVTSDEGLHAAYMKEPGNPSPLPKMKRHCLESYAEECHESGTTKGQFEDFAKGLRQRVTATLTSTPAFSGDGESSARAAAGALVLSYWVNYEETCVDADARTIEFQTRLYAPTGTGASVDVSWRHHFRMRQTIAPEKYSTLYAKSRSLGDACPDDPTRTFDWRKAKVNGAMCLGCLDGDTDPEQVRKKFASLVNLRALCDSLFGPGAKISPRKTFGVLARASGAHTVNNEAGWLYVGMRERYELEKGEESAGEEDGPEMEMMGA